MFKRHLHIILFSHLSLLTCHLHAQQTEKVYLSGTGNDNTVNWEFYCTGGMNANKWTTIPVPSCWELQGFGKYDYGFARDSVRGKEKGMYKYSFNVPASWKNKITRIVFEGVMTDAEVSINGLSAGEMHQGAFYCFKYDITKLLKYGQSNLLEVTVSKHSANESVNAAERRADFWIFGGIFRPVFLEVLPATHMDDIKIDARADGSFGASITSSGRANKAAVEIYDSKGIPQVVIYGANYGNSRDVFIFTHKLQSAKPWSSEFPNLYKAVFKLYNGEQLLHTDTKKFGYRTVEVKQRDGIYVNGVKVKMKGVNRHSFWPTSGRTTSKQISVEDVSLMKDMNMNAVRMSHYPPDDHFLDACDSLGLFVMDELAGWHGNYDTKTGTKLLKEMIDHDKDHPSIIFWSNGNEGGHNLELDSLFKEYDIQQRTVVHPWQLFGGIQTQHYKPYNFGMGNYENGREIVMPTEFLHGQFDGGHGAGLEDYWEKMLRDPLSAGGFLWDFSDQAVVRKDLNDSLDTDKFRGADGIVGPYREKEGSYNAVKEIWSPIYIEKKQITDVFDGKLNIENRYYFTNTLQCSFRWSLGTLGDTSAGSTEVGYFSSPDIEPGQKGTLQMKMPGSWKKYGVLYILAYDPFGRGIFIWSFPISQPAKIVHASMPSLQGSKPQLSERDSFYIITANEVALSINKNSGLISEVKHKGKVIPLTNGPILQEGINNFRNFKQYYEGNNLVIASGFDRKNNYNTLQWTIYPNGWVKMKVIYFPGNGYFNYTGVNFNFPEKEIKGVRYLGNGPYRVWKNRMKGTLLNIWDKSYNNTETGEAPWKYPEFKGYYSNMYWCSFLTGGQSFKVYTATEDVFLRLFTPTPKTDQWHNYELYFPEGDISFLQGIPAIGTKSQRNETTGPMGMKNYYYDFDKDPTRALTLELYFDFTGN